MFYTLLTAVVLVAVFSGWGQIFCFFSGRKRHASLTATLLTGIVGLSSISLIAAFFHRLDLTIEIIFVSIGIGGFFYFKAYQLFNEVLKRNYRLWVICLVIIFAGSFYPFILDHFGYYVPTINVMKSIGLVKGIANLDLILGQMSFWHILSAAFSNFSDPFLRINSVILIIYALCAFEKKHYLHLVFVPIFLLFVQSPSPDLAVLVFSLILTDELLSGNRDFKCLFALSCYIFAIKPTMLWAPLAVLFYTFELKNFRMYFWGIAIILLFFIKNIWCFGYPVFPVRIGNFGVNWQPNSNLMDASAQMAIMKTYDMQYSFQEIRQFSTWEYVRNWFTLSGMKSVINISFIITLIALIFFALKQKSKLIYCLVVALVIKSIAVLMFSAQYRFFLDVFFVATFLIFNKNFKINRMFAISMAGGLAVLVGLSFPSLIQKVVPSFRLGFFMKGFEKQQLYLPSDYDATEFRTFQIGNLKFNAAKNYPYSYKTPAPAISPSFIDSYREAGIFPQLSGISLKEGLIWKKISEKEKKQIQKILNEIGYKPPKSPHHEN